MTATRRRLFTWNPGRDTAIAAVTLLMLTAGYLATSRTSQAWPLDLAIVTVGTAVPAWTIFVHLKQGWSELGITRRWLKTSLAVALVLGAGSAFQLLSLAREQQVDPVAHLVANVFVLWEVFFVFGWLQLRWQKAFGVIPAIVLVGVGFVIQHLGSVPVGQAIGFGFFGLVAAIPFAITNNLFILWPLFYGVASGIGTLQAGLAFGWKAAIASIVLTIVQAAILVWFARRFATAADPDPASPAT